MIYLGLDELHPASKATEASGVAVPNDLAQRTKDTAAFVLDHGTPNRYSPAIAKSYASQTCDRIVWRCMQLRGPEGTSKDVLLEKSYRGVKILDTFEGSGQVPRIVACELVGRIAGSPQDANTAREEESQWV